MPEPRLSDLVVPENAVCIPAPCMTWVDRADEEFVVIDPDTPDIADCEANMVIVVALVSYAFYFALRAIAGALRKKVRYA